MMFSELNAKSLINLHTLKTNPKKSAIVQPQSK